MEKEKKKKTLPSPFRPEGLLLFLSRGPLSPLSLSSPSFWPSRPGSLPLSSSPRGPAPSPSACICSLCSWSVQPVGPTATPPYLFPLSPSNYLAPRSVPLPPQARLLGPSPTSSRRRLRLRLRKESASAPCPLGWRAPHAAPPP